jgi:ssDNA-binding Zn-finger/Zn-ribbon topoisomerase 1
MQEIKNSNKSLKSNTTRESIGGNKIYTGPRGGKYIFVFCNKNKKKKYIK